MNVTPEQLLTADAVRTSTKEIYEYIQSGKGQWKINTNNMSECVDVVVETIRQNYPRLNIPYHSRWRHFDVGGEPRGYRFLSSLSSSQKLSQLQTQFELVITSVLLDAGAGSDWSFEENGARFGRSEGLALASYYMFLEGGFSDDSTTPLKATANGLIRVTTEDLEEAFQVSARNPLIGVEGRVHLLNQLGEAVKNQSRYFPGERLGGFAQFLVETLGTSMEAEDILHHLLFAFSSIWPSRLSLNGQNLGDVWKHPASKSMGGYVAFHKLSQWLTYSLIESLQMCDIQVKGLEKLTGLAEYRNGGLFVDSGLIELKDKSDLAKGHEPSSEIIIEWRALTVQLLDQVAKGVRERLGYSEQQWPLVKILEGGTWAAGRKLAQKYRPDTLSPPINILSDGTVF